MEGRFFNLPNSSYRKGSRLGGAGRRPRLYNIEESDIDILYKSHVRVLICVLLLASGAGSGNGEKETRVGQDTGTVHGPSPLTGPEGSLWILGGGIAEFQWP